MKFDQRCSILTQKPVKIDKNYRLILLSTVSTFVRLKRFVRLDLCPRPYAMFFLKSYHFMMPKSMKLDQIKYACSKILACGA